MYNLLIKLFVKNKDDIKDENVRGSYGALASVFGIVSNTIVCIMKIVVGLFTKTISILADGINNLADALSCFVSLFGFHMSKKRADKKHPYGHQRIEYLAGFIVSVIIIVLGIQLIINSVERIIEPEEITDKFVLNIVILSIAIIVKIYQALFNYRIGKKIDSPTLKATAIDSRNDVLATIAVLIGLIISHYTKYNLDAYFGIIVGLFICISGIKLVLETSSPLIGEAPDPEVVKEMMDLILNNDLILGAHDLEIHSYGPSKKFASCHVEVDSRGDLVTLHDVIDQIEMECRKKYGIITTLHLDPILVGDKKTSEYKEFVLNTLMENLTFSFSIHDFRIVTGPTHTNVIFDLVVPYELEETDEEIEKKVEKLIHEKDETVFSVVNIDHVYSE